MFPGLDLYYVPGMYTDPAPHTVLQTCERQVTIWMIRMIQG